MSNIEDMNSLVSKLMKKMDEDTIQKIKVQSVCGGPPGSSPCGPPGGGRLQMIAYEDMI